MCLQHNFFSDTNVAQKKLENVLTRKPLLDRSVNSKTPDTGKLQKPKVSPKIEDDLNGENFTYSFKDTEGKPME